MTDGPFMFLRSTVVLFACWGLTSAVQAQDFKIYTPVFDMQAAESSPRAGQRPQHPIVARSLSYFHAGKAYDYIEAAEEVLIYEPHAERFTVLDNTRGMATTVAFEELEQMVLEAESNGRNHVHSARLKNAEPSARLDMIEFQLQPSFQERFDRQNNSLVLQSPLMTYQVKCVKSESPERVQFYLKYCDWMARLNFVLHPQSPLPGPRLTLNESLRKKGVMPENVTLQAAIGGGINLKAEHSITWKLDAIDRERIHQWQVQLEGQQIQHVDFRKFREVQLTAKR